MLKISTNYLPDPTEYAKFFCEYIFKTLIEKIIYFYTTVNGFLDQKFITFLTNEKIANEFNKTKNMDLETLIKEFLELDGLHFIGH